MNYLSLDFLLVLGITAAAVVVLVRRSRSKRRQTEQHGCDGCSGCIEGCECPQVTLEEQPR